jgi:hypothetical protein
MTELSLHGIHLPSCKEKREVSPVMEWTARNGIINAKLAVLIRNQQRGAAHDKDEHDWFGLAKNVLQIRGIDAVGNVVLRRQLQRGQMEKLFAELPPTVVAMEAV